jgi:hypothetical protein
MFNPSRSEARRFFFDAWSKYRRGEPLAGLEQTALGVILLHPEYHALLEQDERNLDRDFSPEDGQLNPFLHLSLHLAVEEQISIDQPQGLRTRYDALLKKSGSQHDALHDVIECLGETLWQAQRTGTAPDEALYLECVERKASRRPG